ncbi:hypothetical protein GCM10010193_69950 [Kitasatospora atroaurantiaca]|uniref:Protein ImuA n=1 Tax=Kitasatospora atroaurantiaca TaxID=285545 RepID=A0A561EN96_9ACTN|nr:hypothetical protein [Kitasatospora atroaurantiaca]TWE17080.1 hypothetical protein FB465_2085 [Kitasatospora atroaurantiaca]
MSAGPEERLAGLLELTSPAARAREGAVQTIPVLPELAGLLPDGGLRPGTVTEVSDLGLLAALTAECRGWAAVIGMPELGLGALAGYGMDLQHLMLVDDPGEHWAEVFSALAPVVDLILLTPTTPLTPTLARRLSARLRQHRCAVLTPAHWPGAQLRLEVESHGWTGLGDGFGQLQSRRVAVRTAGRGGGLGRSAELLLPDEHGTVTALDGAEARQPDAGAFVDLAAVAY